MNELFRKIGDIIKSYSKFLIVSHKNPDGDAIGSSLAFYNVLKEMGKTVYVENPTMVPLLYRFLEDCDKIELISNKKDVEVVIAVDTAELDRCGLDRDYVKDKVFINIDHHKTNTMFADINLIDSNAAAVGCILWDLFRENGFDISLKSATCLYTSILTDTGSFRYASTSPKTMRIAADLIEKGVNPWFVAYNVYESRKLKTLRLLGLVLNTLETYYDGKLAMEYVTQDMFKKTDTSVESTEGFVNFARSVREAEVGVLLREDEPNYFKVSMRSKDKVDVSKAATLAFGGGGHKNAAGGQIEGTLEEVKKKIIEAFSFLA